MDISGSAAIGALASATGSQALSVKVLKKALDLQAASAQALIQSLPKPAQAASHLPDTIGRNIDTTA